MALASTIITNARSYLNESTASFWTDTELLVYLNNGTLDIVSRTKCLENTEPISILPNTIEYSITGPYIEIIAVVYNEPGGIRKGLIHKELNEIGSIRDVGEPVYWYEWNEKVGLFPAPRIVTDANLSIGTTPTNIASAAFSYEISGVVYSKGGVPAGTAPGTNVVPQSKYGAVALDIGSDGVVDAISAYTNSIGYTSAALAVSGIPQVSDGHVRLGYVTVIKSDGAFTFGTTALNAANVTTVYTDSLPTATIYFTERPISVVASDSVLVPTIYETALTLYIAAQGMLKERQYGRAGQLMSAYSSELDRYRTDIVEQSEE